VIVDLSCPSNAEAQRPGPPREGQDFHRAARVGRHRLGPSALDRGPRL